MLNLVGNLQTSDAGIYQCVAVNLGGTGTANYSLTINGNITFILTFWFHFTLIYYSNSNIYHKTFKCIS